MPDAGYLEIFRLVATGNIPGISVTCCMNYTGFFFHVKQVK